MRASRRRPIPWKRDGMPSAAHLQALARHSASGLRRDERAAEQPDTRGPRRSRTMGHRWPSAKERDGAPPQGTRRHRELHGPRLIWELPLGYRGRGMPAAALPPAQAITTPTDAVRQRCPARQRRPHRNVREFLHPHATPTAPSRTPPCRSHGTRIPYQQKTLPP